MPEGGRRPVVGVTGLPCAGKSYVSGLLASGAVTGERGEALHADNIGHDILRCPDVARKVAGRFGPGVVGADGAIDRAKVAGMVFADPGELSWLEALLHPEINAEIAKAIRRNGGRRLIVLEAALLFAVGMEKLCDLVLVVEAPLQVRLRRAAARGWDKRELARREARLSPLFEKTRLAACQARIAIIQNDENDDGLPERLAAALSGVNQRKVKQ